MSANTTAFSPAPERGWSLGPVLAEREVDPRTYVLVVRPDAGPAAALELRRRLLGLMLAGHTTLLVDLDGAERATDAVLSALMQARRKLAARDGRLIVAASQPTLRTALAGLGFELD
jgi:anti-anti-sigma regulatory factor